MPVRHKDRVPKPTKPGEVLEEEWMKPLGLTQSGLAKLVGLDVQVINQIIKKDRAITADTALCLASALNTTPDFWMGLQASVDLWKAGEKRKLATVERKAVSGSRR